jgi:hypothetical protein
MENLLAYLVVILIFVLVILASALFIMFSIHDLKRKKYFEFGLDLTTAIICIVVVIKLVLRM